MPEENIVTHMNKLKKQMEKSFAEFWQKPKMAALPTMNRELAGFNGQLSDEITVKGNKVLAKLKMPGMDKKDIVLNVGNDFIEVKAQKKQERKEDGRGFFRQERTMASYYRKLPLPMPVKPELAECHFKDGVFEVMMPRAELKRIAKK